MKSLKKTLVLLVVLSMILSAVSPVFAFSDVVAEEYAEQANKMAAFGVFAGDANGNFNAEAEITRAEMAVIIGKLMGLTESEANANKVYASAFTDVAAGEWYTGWINLAAGRGIISGFPDGTFRPNEKVTQAQAVTMIVKALGWGVVVDQTGTWPANYITKAAELRLFKDAVATDSELVTRGNVAIYCYNALTAKTWDVTESTDGKLTSSKTNDTILAKYFSDFVNEGGDMKLVEDVEVTVSGATTNVIGERQVKLSSTGIKNFIDAEKEPRKDKEEATYYVDANTVVAYVPASVAKLTSVAGKKVDVIFGKDNVVVYLNVTDDAFEDAVVTAYNNTDKTIEIDGTEYDVDSNVKVNVYGYPYGKGTAAINTLLVTKLGITNPKKTMTKNVVAEYTLNPDDEIETINFKFDKNGFTMDILEDSDYTTDTTKDLTISDCIVEKRSSKDVLSVEGNLTEKNLEKLEDGDDPRVIKNGEVATVYDIEVGDVIVEVKADSKVVTLIVSSATVEGEVTDLNKSAFEIDGENYNYARLFYNEDGDVDDYSTAVSEAALFSTFEEEVVVAYLNVYGEIVAMVGESEATGMVLGVVTGAADLKEDNDDVEYIKVKLLTEEGTNKYFYIYNKKSGKDISDAAEYGVGAGKYKETDFTVGNLVRFEADSSRKIASDDVEFVTTGNTYDFKSETGVLATKLTSTPTNIIGDAANDVNTVTITVDSDKKTLNTKRYTSSTVVINPAEEELINKWDALTRATDTFVYTKLDTDAWLFTKGTKVVYVVAAVEANYLGASDDQYGILLDTRRDKDEDDETIYIATVLVNGVEEEYECDSAVRAYDEGTFVKFNVTDGEFKADPTKLVLSDIVDYIDSLDDTAAMASIATYLPADYTADPNITAYFKTISSTTKLNAIEVDTVEVVDGESYVVFDDDSTVDLAKGYIVYSLADMAEVDEIAEGNHILVWDYDTDEDGFNIVLVLDK